MQDSVETANFDLSNVRREKSDLVDMNENLSNQISEQLNGIKKLQDYEQDLMQKLENSKRDLELAHNGKIKLFFRRPSQLHRGFSNSLMIVLGKGVPLAS